MPSPGIRLAVLVLAVHAVLAAAALAETPASPSAPAAKPPAPGTLFIYPERIPLEAGKSATVERGLLFVPANRSRPESGVFAIEFYRFRAAPGVPADRPPVFRLHGGPGWPGLSRSLQDPEYYQKTVVPQIEIADRVIVGQRGIGSSKPDTHCDGVAPLPLDVETTAEQAAKIMYETSKRCREFWEGQGVDLAGLTVVEAAADVDDLRRALGYEKIALSGGRTPRSRP